MASPHLVIFDVDGTLVDSQDHICAAMDRALAAVGRVPLPRLAVLSIVGLSLAEAVARLLPDATADEHGRIVAAYRGAFSDLRAKGDMPLFPGARAALDALRSSDDVILGIATGKSRRGLDHLIASHGLGGYFMTRQVADHHPSKPHPSMVLAALAETGVPARRAVMVGDTTYDIEMGRAAGLATLGVAWGYHPAAALAKAGADAVLDDFSALPGALCGLWSDR